MGRTAAMRRAVTRKSSLAGPPALGHPPFGHPGFATRQSTILPRLPRAGIVWRAATLAISRRRHLRDQKGSELG
eukprot:scaffold69178_cov33-Phaeocystis_antarctica.AAC.1